MTSPRKCVGDVFSITFILFCTFVANGYCDNFNKNYKETFKPRHFNPRSINENSGENRIDFGYSTTAELKSKIENYATPNTADDWSDDIQCRCNVTKFPSESTSIVDCHNCVHSEHEEEDGDDNNKLLTQLNYAQYDASETIYLKSNFENLTDRQRRDVIDESSTSANGLRGK